MELSYISDGRSYDLPAFNVFVSLTPMFNFFTLMLEIFITLMEIEKLVNIFTETTFKTGTENKQEIRN